MDGQQPEIKAGPVKFLTTMSIMDRYADHSPEDKCYHCEVRRMFAKLGKKMLDNNETGPTAIADFGREIEKQMMEMSSDLRTDL